MDDKQQTALFYDSVHIKQARVLVKKETNSASSNVADEQVDAPRPEQQQEEEEDQFESTKPVKAVESPLGSFEIEFECNIETKPIEADKNSENANADQYPLEFEMIYVGDSSNIKQDQLLERIELGPLTESGVFKFVLEDVKAPDYTKIRNDEILGVTFAILRCSFRGKIFANIGFYVKTFYDSDELNENPPAEPQLDRLLRAIGLDSQINEFSIEWQGSDEYYATEVVDDSEKMIDVLKNQQHIIDNNIDDDDDEEDEDSENSSGDEEMSGSEIDDEDCSEGSDECSDESSNENIQQNEALDTLVNDENKNIDIQVLEPASKAMKLDSDKVSSSPSKLPNQKHADA